MPKVVVKKPVGVDPTGAYRTAPWPESTHGAERRDLLNGQTCTCGHDRLTHSCFRGEGESRAVFVEVPHAGACLTGTCRCRGFVYSLLQSSVEGRRKREREKKQYKVVPPAGK